MKKRINSTTLLVAILLTFCFVLMYNNHVLNSKLTTFENLTREFVLTQIEINIDHNNRVNNLTNYVIILEKDLRKKHNLEYKKKRNQNLKEFTLYTKDNCSYCLKAKTLLKIKNLEYTELKIPDQADREMIQERVFESGSTVEVRSVPQIFHGNRYVGGYNELSNYIINYCSNQET